MSDLQDISTEGYLAPAARDLVTPGRRVIVTGASGFIGTNLLQALRLGGAEAINLDRKPPRWEAHREHWREVDLLDREKLVACVRDFEPELLFHLAARTDLFEKKEIRGYAANMDGVANLLAAMEGLASLRRTVITSTQLVCRYGYVPQHDEDYCPHTLYGESKIETERLTRAWERPPCPWTLVRPTSIWGPWFDAPYRDFFIAVARRRYRHIRGRNPLRSFGFVGNAVYQYLKLAAAPEASVDRRTFYMSDLEPVRVRDWANVIQAEMGLPPIGELPLPVLRVAGKVGDVLWRLGWKNVPMTSFRLRNMLSENPFDMSAVREVCGAMPYDQRDGVRVTVRWLREAGLA